MFFAIPVPKWLTKQEFMVVYFAFQLKGYQPSEALEF